MLAHFNLGYALFRHSVELHPRALREAIVEFKEAIRLDSTDAQPYEGLGSALLVDGDLEGAAAAFAQAIRLNPDYPWPHHGLGHLLMERDEADAAIAKFREAIRLAAKWPEEPEFAELHSDLGTALLNQKDFEGAIAEHRIVIRLDPNNPEGHKGLARALAERGDTKAAFELLRAQADRHPEWLPIVSNNIRYDLASYAVMWSSAEASGAPSKTEVRALRQQALVWLQADLAEWNSRSTDDELRSTIAEEMTNWLDDEDFASVRDKNSLKRMPESERQSWQQLWADVRRLRDATTLEVLPLPRERTTPKGN